MSVNRRVEHWGDEGTRGGLRLELSESRANEVDTRE